jgi:hypothetical protein
MCKKLWLALILAELAPGPETRKSENLDGRFSKHRALSKYRTSLPTATGVESVVNDVINAVAKKGAVLVGLGIDSLLSSDHRAWRNVDLWLRAQYPSSKRSIVSFHSAYGPLAIGGADAAWLLATQYECGLVPPVVATVRP